MGIYNPDGSGGGGRAVSTSLTDGKMWFTERQVIIPAGGTDKAMIRTGDTRVLLKQREFRFKGMRVSFTIYKAPTVTSTGAESFEAYNVAPVAGQTRKLKLFPSPTTTANGTQYIPISSFQGDANVFTKQTCFPVILEPNSDYLFITTNLDAASSVDLRVRAVFIETNDDVTPLLLDSRIEL